MRLNVDREPGFYHDESGERFQQIFREAEEKREDQRNNLWAAVVVATIITICLAFVAAKLYSMGAIVGIK